MSEIVRQTPLRTTEMPGTDDLPKVGEWYWVKGGDDDAPRWLGCVTHVGSNYANLCGPSERYTDSEHSCRVHLDEFDEECTREHDPDSIIEQKIAHHRANAHRLMGEVRALTSRLAISPRSTLNDSGNQGEVHALVVRGASHGSFDSYKADLVKAKEKTLPDLFKEIESANKFMGSWMKANLTPLRAEADAMRSSIDLIEDRVFNVELYAGLVETVTQIANGKGAAPADPIYLMQRRHYMDEECLAHYKTGGMEFRDIRDFNKWLAKRENAERILPHPRCIVAFRVRRNDKEHNYVSLSDFINIRFAHEADATTFLYMRNGKQIYALQTEIEFGEKLFPDIEREVLDRGDLWGKMFGTRVEKIISDARYQGMIEENERAKTEYDEKVKKTPKKDRWKEHGSFFPPHNSVDSYVKFTPETVYFDDIAKYVTARAKEHNRLALVLQGLLDRSPVFLPHPRWQIYTEAGFRAGIRLVHDDSRALVPAEKPDFEAYRTRLNESLKAGSVAVGQEETWERREAAKENARDRHHNVNYKHFRPYGNPGPGTLARIAHFAPRSKKCTFTWERERSWSSRRYGNASATVETSLVLPSSAVLNVNAYKPGDFKQFYADPRTRTEYLKWAPLLLEAEEYHAGNRKLRGEEGNDAEED